MQLSQPISHGSIREQWLHCHPDNIPTPLPDPPTPVVTDSNDPAHPTTSNSSSSPPPVFTIETGTTSPSSTKLNPDLQLQQNKAIVDRNEGGEVTDVPSNNDWTDRYVQEYIFMQLK